MMRGPSGWAVAVRRPDDTLVVDHHPRAAAVRRHAWLRLPVVRGVAVLVEALVLGVAALTYSAQQAAGDDAKPGRLALAATVLLAVVLGAVLFLALPALAAHLAQGFVRGGVAQNLVEGAVRLGVFLAYVAAIGLFPDIKRVQAYHGAEHKVINAFEAGAELEVSAVRPFSTFHPRCGTSFLFLVLVVSIFVFSLVDHLILWWRLASRLVLLPVVAGLGYELVRLSNEYYRTPWGRLVAAPGKFLQGLTTREPDDAQIEVALAALRSVLEGGGETRVR
ncbi:MAG: DUF1385 domain-containing protein [Firmicutes bacterium]|nr:DUF1385 domain-containing protein [Bacillota bacterium]